MSEDETKEYKTICIFVDGDFKVTVVTSGESKGFDDQVYLTVFGDAGNSGQLPLGEPGTGLFQAGTTDIFPVIRIYISYL